MAFLYNWYYGRLDRYFTMKLSKNKKLSSYLIETPQAFTIPVKESKKRGMVIWLVLKSDIHLSLRLIADVINLSVDTIKNDLLLNGLVGVEIVPGFRLENQEIDRILRASIWAGNYIKWSRLKPIDILKEKPIDGVQCGWYWDASKIPIEEIKIDSNNTVD